MFSLGMLNDYRILDYRIKCLFSFLFVSDLILEYFVALLLYALLYALVCTVHYGTAVLC